MSTIAREIFESLSNTSLNVDQSRWLFLSPAKSLVAAVTDVYSQLTLFLSTTSLHILLSLIFRYETLAVERCGMD